MLENYRPRVSGGFLAGTIILIQLVYIVNDNDNDNDNFINEHNKRV